MKRTFVLLAVLLVVPSLWTQVRTGSAKSSDFLGNDKAQVTKALVESGTIVESETKKEFFLVPKKPESGTQTVRTWRFGYKELGPEQGLVVEIQVGEYQGKPVFLLLRVPPERGQAEVDDSMKVLTEAIGEGRQVFNQFKFQSCSDGKKCVKSCKDDKGRLFCCRYECVKKPF